MPNKIGTYLYNSLPSVYKTRDEETNFTLKKYLNALGESMTDIELETKNIITLLDVEKMDAKYLPFYASMFGVTYNYDISEDYQRKYLANLVDIQKRKGTKEVLEFTAREITGMEATVIEGQALAFKTWSNKNSTGSITSRNPRTYNKRSMVNYYYLGGEVSDRFTVTVLLSAEGHIDSEQLFLNTQLISRITKDLVQPYIKLRYKAHSIAYSDVYTPSIVEEDIIVVKDVEQVRRPNIVEGDILLNGTESYSDVHTSKIVTSYSNKVTLETNSESRTNRVSESNHSDKVVEIHNLNVAVSVDSTDNSTVDMTPTEEIIKAIVTQGQKTDLVQLSINEDTIELQNTQEGISDYIHLDITNDIINLSGKVSDSFEDSFGEITDTE